MIWSASAINKYAVAAKDGQMGSVSDFLFDDVHWKVRWLVIDINDQVDARKVIVPINVLGRPDQDRRLLTVDLTREQIEASPAVGSHGPVGRDIEANAAEYYGESPYWGAGYLGGYHAQWASTPFPVADAAREREAAETQLDKYNPSLRSFELLSGYHVEGRDGDIGHVEDFLVDDTDWTIRFLVVDTRNWWAGKRVLVSPGSVVEIDWQEKMVSLDADRDMVKGSPAYEPSNTIDDAWADQVHRHYGIWPAAPASR